MIKEDAVLLNGQPAKPSRRLKVTDEIMVSLNEENVTTTLEQDIEFEIVNEDSGLIAVNKPPHLPVHPGSGRPAGTLVNGLVYRYPDIKAVGGVGRPGIVHRLDMDTSGILVVARTREEYLSLIQQFANRTVTKKYLALVEGDMPHDCGVISAPISRSKSDRRKMGVDWSGKEAVTRFRVVARSNRATFLELELVTGRTHQVRVHLGAVGHPVINDLAYGKQAPTVLGTDNSQVTSRQMLHAWQICLLRLDGRQITCYAAAPNDIQITAAKLGIDKLVFSKYLKTGYKQQEVTHQHS